MSLSALKKEIVNLSDKEEWLDCSALRLAAMKTYVINADKNNQNLKRKAEAIMKQAFSEQETLKVNK